MQMGKLYEAFSFTREELHANKVALLTSTQEKKLAGYRKSEGCGTLLAILSVVFTGIFLVLISLFFLFWVRFEVGELIQEKLVLQRVK